MLTVLIVEDELSIAELLRDALEDDGYGVIGIARTLDDAVLLVKQNSPDVAIVDIRLADGDSGTNLRARLDETIRPRILFSTGSASDEDLLGSYGDAVITKPYRLEDVGQALRIIDEIARHGRTDLPFPANFRLLTPETAAGYGR
jgi:DNA-binding response OmpR family regulator